MDLTAWAPAVIALVGSAATLGAVRQSHKDLKESVDKIDQRNENTHKTLFSKIEAEAEKREAEDKDIRKNYVAREQCVLMQCAVPTKARGAHGD